MNDSSPQAHSGALNEAATSAPHTEAVGSKDGEGADDNDSTFGGFHAFQFSTRQMLRLLFLRSDVLDAHLGEGPFVDDVAAS